MEKKLIFGLFLLFFSFSFASANFVCGVVVSNDSLSPQWQKIEIFYPNNPFNYSVCEVSPAGNKFCCDTESIPGKKWSTGDIVGARILDFDNGYFAGPLTIETTGKGYDLFPDLLMLKVINFENKQSFFIQNSTSYNLNLSINGPYNNVSYSLNGNQKTPLCYNCSRIDSNLEMEFGTNNLSVFASDGFFSFNESKKITLLKNVSFKRNFLCNKCSNDKLPQDTIIDVEIAVNFSHKVNGLIAMEYIPSSFKIINSYGDIFNYSESHNYILWNISGNQSILKYQIQTPKISFLPKKYLFNFAIEDNEIENSSVIVYHFFPFFPINEKMTIRPKKIMPLFMSSNEKPIIIKDKEIFKRIIVFSNNQNKKLVGFDVVSYNDPSESMAEIYELVATLSNDEIDKIILEIERKKIEKSRLFYYSQEDKWKEISINDSSDENFINLTFKNIQKIKVLKGKK